ncbi:MAG TPA: AMP-binding protein [Candidatus Angelobacter sp.]|jgi:fatty-acyl-CoA synthase|nr:AMP-binding protein [Candidatus Angelobacter sp.]
MLSDNLIHRFNAGDALRRAAVRSPRQRALHFQGRDLNYSELDELANRIARLLLANGIGRGDSVAIFSMNSPEFVATFFGCARIGAALVPINLMFTGDDVDYVFEKTRVKALLVEPVFLDKVHRKPGVCFSMDSAFCQTLAGYDGSPVEQFVSSEDTSLIVFTSGTTARPKGVVLTHLNLYAYLLATVTEHGVDRSFRYLLALPMFHIAGLVQSFACFASGCDSVILPLPKVEPIFHAIQVHRINVMALPATLWVGLAGVPGIETADLSCLRRLFVFQYLPTPVFNRWRQMAPQAEWINAWGQTETTAIGSSTPPAELQQMLTSPDPIGLEHMPLELRIVDDDMNDVEPGKPGEIVVRGPSITPGYFEDPEANEALFRGGWHHTGDVAYRDEHGWLYFLDRKKDMIKTGGENVSSQEVEEAIAQHPGVAEVAVIGMPDPYWIEKVVACVVPLAGVQLTEQELLVHARSRLANFKVPKQLFILKEFPKNPSGKVLKRILRQQLSADVSGATA